MIEALNNLDTTVFLYLNNLHNPFFDSIMLFLSYNMIPISVALITFILLGFKKFKLLIIPISLFLIISFGLSDSISTRVFKDNFKRLRPCHNPMLAKNVHLAGQRCWGGKYGFVSSHAANSFSIAMFFWLLFRKSFKNIRYLFIYSAMVSYSRIYLAKHYPLDIICGAILGLICAYFSYKIMLILFNKLNLSFEN